ncbi:MAG: cation:proton antiporter [Candidatus Methanomethylicaceae archaeon]
MDELTGFAAILLLASFSVLILKRFKIATVAAYIIAGLVVGPILGIVDPTTRSVAFLSDVGIALISFQIGLSVNPRLIRQSALQILAVSTLELGFVVFFSSVFGIVSSIPMATTLIIALMAVNSSTCITFKLLEGRGIVNHRLFPIVVGVGMVEDATVMVGISLMPALATLGKLMVGEAFSMVGNMIALVLVFFAVGFQLLPRLIKYVMRYGDMETLLLIILAIALGYGIVSGYMGLSFALGSFLAGVIVSTIELPEGVMERLTSLRELFAMIFFISIGLSMPYVVNPTVLLVSVGLSLVIIVIKELSITTASWIGLGFRDAFRMGIYMMPISELALVVAKEGYRAGLVDQKIFISSAFVVLVSVVMASKLVERDEMVAERLYSLVPNFIQNGMEKISSAMKIIFEKILVSEGYRTILTRLGKKLLSLIAVLTMRSIVMQGVLALEELSNIAFLVESITASIILVLLIVIVWMSRGDLEALIAMYTSSLRGGTRKRVASLIKNAFYLLILAVVSVLVILNASSILRSVLSGYFEAGMAGGLLLLIIVCLMVLIIYILYGRVKRVLESIEASFGFFGGSE